MLLYLSMIDDVHDKEKFSKLYYKYRRLLFSVANGILHNTADAEDVLQEAFIKVTKNMKNIGEIDCPETRNYLVIIVRRVAFTHIKKHNANILIPIENVEDAVLNNASSEEIVESQESLEALKGCIGMLPKAYSDILVYKYFDGLTNKEIGKLLKISQDNVYKTLQRAKISLSKKLKEKGDISNDF